MNVLEERYQSYLNCGNSFGSAQVNTFFSLLGNSYGRILEVGCGKGFFTYLMLKEKGFKTDAVYGADIFADYQEEWIKKIVPKTFFRLIPQSGRLPFSGDKFDLTFSIDVLEHVHDPRQFIGEHIRVTKSGGDVIFGTPNLCRLSNFFLFLLGKLKFPRKIGVDSYGEIIHIKEYSKNDLLKLLISFKREIGSIKIIPCWFGSSPMKIGIKHPQGFLSNFCQFWFVKFQKI